MSYRTFGQFDFLGRLCPHMAGCTHLDFKPERQFHVAKEPFNSIRITALAAYPVA